MTYINSKHKFLVELSKFLTFLTPEEKEQVLNQFEKIFACAPSEEDVLTALGSPVKTTVSLSRAYTAGGIEAALSCCEDMAGIDISSYNVENSHPESERIPDELIDSVHEAAVAAVEQGGSDPELESKVSDVVRTAKKNEEARQELNSADFTPFVTAAGTQDTPMEPVVPSAEEEAVEPPANQSESPSQIPSAESGDAEEPTSEDFGPDVFPAVQKTEPEVSVSQETRTLDFMPEDPTEPPATPPSAEDGPEATWYLNADEYESGSSSNEDVTPLLDLDATRPVRTLSPVGEQEGQSNNDGIHELFEKLEEKEEEKPETVSKANWFLLILYIIIAIPVGIVAIVLCLAIAACLLGLCAGCITAGVAATHIIFSGLALFSDIIMAIGVALVGYALGIFLFFFAIWFAYEGISWLISSIISLGGKWCFKEVPIE